MTTANISGAVIVVTGAGSGIGRASALMLAERGATVVAVDRDGEAIDKVTATTGGLAIAVDTSRRCHPRTSRRWSR
jgi:NADP-dependent 3-hydroxy acid dehydrogenase YdfG